MSSLGISKIKLKVVVILIAISAIIILVLLVYSLIVIDKRKERECALNPPSEYFIEEDMEHRLISRALYVYDKDLSEYGHAVYYIRDISTQKEYKVAYNIAKDDFSGLSFWKWKFCSFIEI